MPSLPAPPAVYSDDFNGIFVTPAVQGRILSLLADQAPFANSLTRLPISGAGVVFPVASPAGAGWVPELGEIPTMTLNDDSVLVTVAKLAGLLDVSNELVSDASINITSAFGRLLGDSLSPQLDQGLLYGQGGAEPAGIVAMAPAVTATTLLEAISAAVGQISDAGGTADTVAAPGSVWSTEGGRVDTEGHPLYPGGFGAFVGLKVVGVPNMAELLVYDSTRITLVINGPMSSVDLSNQYHFANDATAMRVKLRAAAGCPTPAKSIRKWTIPAAPLSSSTSSTSSKKA